MKKPDKYDWGMSWLELVWKTSKYHYRSVSSHPKRGSGSKVSIYFLSWRGGIALAQKPREWHLCKFWASEISYKTCWRFRINLSFRISRSVNAKVYKVSVMSTPWLGSFAYPQSTDRQSKLDVFIFTQGISSLVQSCLYQGSSTNATSPTTGGKIFSTEMVPHFTQYMKKVNTQYMKKVRKRRDN